MKKKTKKRIIYGTLTTVAVIGGGYLAYKKCPAFKGMVDKTIKFLVASDNKCSCNNMEERRRVEIPKGEVPRIKLSEIEKKHFNNNK